MITHLWGGGKIPMPEMGDMDSIEGKPDVGGFSS